MYNKSYKDFFYVICMVSIICLVASGCSSLDDKEDDPFFAQHPALKAQPEKTEKAKESPQKDGKKEAQPVTAPADKAFMDKNAWKLEECIEYALRNSEKIKSIREKRKSKDGEIIEAWSDYLPTAVFKYSHGKSNETGESDIYNISGKTLIWCCGKVKSNVKKIQAEKAMHTEEMKQEVLDVVYNVKSAFYETLFRQYHVESKKIALETAQRVQSDTEKLVQGGQAREVDIFGTKAQVADAERELFESTNGYDLVRKQLNHYMGRDLNAPFSPQGKLAFRQIPLYRDKLSAKALAENPMLKKIDKALEKVNFSKELAYRRNFPNFYAVGSFEYRDTSKVYQFGTEQEKLFQGRAYGIGVEIELPLFRQMGIGYGQKKQAEQMAKSLQADQQNAKREISYNIEKICNKMEEAIHTIHTAQVALQYRDKMVETIIKGIAASLYQQKDLLEAQKKQSETNVMLMKGILEYNIAKLELDRILGILDTTGAVE